MDKSYLVAARILHDLAAPISAAGMGMSLLKENPSDRQALDMTAESIHRLHTTFTCLRALFATEHAHSWSRMYDVLNAYAHIHHTTITCCSTNQMPHIWDDIVPLLCLIGIDAFTGIKNINIEADHHILNMHIRGERYILPQNTLDMLDTEHQIQHFAPTSIHIYYLNTHLKKHKIQLQVNLDHLPDQISFTVHRASHALSTSMVPV